MTCPSCDMRMKSVVRHIGFMVTRDFYECRNPMCLDYGTDTSLEAETNPSDLEMAGFRQ